jgi:hypothetical protein
MQAPNAGRMMQEIDEFTNKDRFLELIKKEYEKILKI